MLIEASQLKVAPRALMFDPEFYLFDFSSEHRITKFLLVDEQTLRLAPFVDIRFEPMARGSFLMGTNELMTLEQQHGLRRPRASFIFHHAFVCSTLLARCLDQIDAFFSLKEPWIIRRLADTKRQPRSRLPRSRWRRLFSTYMSVLCKPYASGQSPVIKLTNVANNLLPDVLCNLPESRSLFLYSDLRAFLVSNLKKPPETRSKMPALAQEFCRDYGFARRFPEYCDFENLSFLQVCALTWAASLFNFSQAVERCSAPNVCTLDADTFLESPGPSLRALARFFGHDSSAEEIAAMTSPGVLGRNAKQQQQAYGPGERAREARLMLRRHAGPIAEAMDWIDPLVERLGLIRFMRARRLD